MSSKIDKLKKLGLIDSTTHSSITERIKQIESDTEVRVSDLKNKLSSYSNKEIKELFKDKLGCDFNL